jgi:hypothetical protein
VHVAVYLPLALPVLATGSAMEAARDLHGLIQLAGGP